MGGVRVAACPVGGRERVHAPTLPPAASRPSPSTAVLVAGLLRTVPGALPCAAQKTPHRVTLDAQCLWAASPLWEACVRAALTPQALATSVSVCSVRPGCVLAARDDAQCGHICSALGRVYACQYVLYSFCTWVSYVCQHVLAHATAHGSMRTVRFVSDHQCACVTACVPLFPICALELGTAPSWVRPTSHRDSFVRAAHAFVSR